MIFWNSTSVWGVTWGSWPIQNEIWYWSHFKKWCKELHKTNWIRKKPRLSTKARSVNIALEFIWKEISSLAKRCTLNNVLLNIIKNKGDNILIWIKESLTHHCLLGLLKKTPNNIQMLKSLFECVLFFFFFSKCVCYCSIFLFFCFSFVCKCSICCNDFMFCVNPRKSSKCSASANGDPNKILNPESHPSSLGPLLKMHVETKCFCHVWK